MEMIFPTKEPSKISEDATANQTKQFLHTIKKKDEQLQTLYALVKEKNNNQESVRAPHEDTIQKIVESLEASFSKLIIEHLHMKREWEKTVNDLSKKIVQLRYELQETNLKLITTQKDLKAANDKINSRFLKRIKKSIAPKIGRLYQYPPVPFTTPTHYHQKKSLKTTPTISIVTPSFNQGNFIERTIISVVDQGYPNIEYIIQDGGSQDHSREVITLYAHTLKHFQFKKDKGQSHALNLGFKHATGEIMAYLNADDLLLTGSLNYVADYFNKHPDVDVVYGHRVLIDENDLEIGRWVLPPHEQEVLSWADYVPQETLFWRRSIWEKVGGKIDESFKFAMDWDLILRFREAGAKFVRLPRFLGAFRIHPNQKTSSVINRVGMKEMARLRQRCHGRKVTDKEINKKIRPYLLKHLLFHRLFRLGIFRY